MLFKKWEKEETSFACSLFLQVSKRIIYQLLLFCRVTIECHDTLKAVLA